MDSGLWDLLDRLDAAAQDADAYHHDLCGQFEPGAPCTCGAPRWIRETAAWMRGQAVEAALRESARA